MGISHFSDTINLLLNTARGDDRLTPAVLLAWREIVQISVSLPGHQRAKEIRLKQRLRIHHGPNFELESFWFLA